MRVLLTTVILALAPRVALACPACALVGVKENSTAYVSMTIMLMALPLGMILGIATWLYRSARRVEDELTIPSRKPAEATDILREADVVLYDSLVDTRLLEDLDAELVFVGKRCGDHHMPQEAITELLNLVCLARRRQTAGRDRMQAPL